MGWTITHGAKRRDIIKSRTTDYEDDHQRRECLASAVRGNCLWTAWEITRKKDNTKERYIGLDLLGTDGEGNWGYKDLEEGMGLSETSCPLSFLTLVPEVAHAGWRESVRRRHARRNQKLAVGQILKLVNATIPYVSITSLRPLMGTYLGATYRIPRRLLPEPEEPMEAAALAQQPSDDKQTSLFAA